MPEQAPSSSFVNTITMLVLSALKKVIWALRYPSFATESGPYRVGAIQARIPGTVQCQIHYPTTSDNNAQSPSFYPYMRPKAVKGIADYARSDADLMSFLSNRDHPCVINGDPAKTEQDGKYPLVIFSHGLGGCMEMYTQLCQQIASYGYCVVAMEHEDGSGAYAETKEGDRIPYKRPDDSPYTRQKVLNFRRAFLKQRVEETSSVLDYIMQPENSSVNSPVNNGEDDKLLQTVLQSVDTTSGKVAFVGHSFGGSTMVLAAQKYLAEQKQNQGTQSIRPSSLTVYDPWAFSLEDDALNQGIDGIPMLSVLSENWLTNPETAQVDQLLQNCPTAVSLYAPNSVHASFADSVSWLPGFILRRLWLRGRNEKRHETLEATTKVCMQQFETGVIEDVGTLKEYKFQKIQPEKAKKAVLTA